MFEHPLDETRLPVSALLCGTMVSMPSFARFQQSGTCSTCNGAVRFYPAPVDDPTEDPDGELGEWVHLNPADWRDDPHPAAVA